MKASAYGIKNLQRILPNLITWTKTPNDDYVNLNEMYGEVVTQFRRYIGHVVYNFGGVYETYKKNAQDGVVYEYVSKSTQKEAIDFLTKQERADLVTFMESLNGETPLPGGRAQ